jgi:hypothetical protein
MLGHVSLGSHLDLETTSSSWMDLDLQPPDPNEVIFLERPLTQSSGAGPGLSLLQRGHPIFSRQSPGGSS